MKKDRKNINNNFEEHEIPDSGYWRGFKELYRETTSINDNKNDHEEGISGVHNPVKLPSISRRKFLALASVSAAFAAAGCSTYKDNGDIVPYNKMPEEIIVGKANYYASTSTASADACGILIKTREGRPIKIDGNPDHPVGKGKTSAKCQANILSLYDPQRLREPMKKGGTGNFLKSTWKQVDTEIISALNNSNGKEVALITNSIVSPTAKKAIDDFKEKYPGTKVYSYELFNDKIRNSAWKKCYGSDHFPLIQWDNANILVSLESDFLESEGNKVETARMFADRRDVNHPERFSRLYVFEGNLSVTGINADYRFRLRPDAQYEFVLSLLSELNNRGIQGISIDTQKYSLENFAKKYSLSYKKLNLLVGDLIKNKGEAIVHAGNTLPEHVHIAVNVLNDALGNNALYRTDAASITLVPHAEKSDWENLIQSMNSGNVAAVIHFDSNPAFHLPKDFGYENAINKVPTIISLVGSNNESSVLGHYVLPIHHDLEAWGDAKTRTGFYSFQQPVIDPIFNSRQKEAALLVWTNGSPPLYEATIYHKYLKQNWEKNIYPGLNSKLTFNEFWNAALHDGVVFVNEKPAGIGNFNRSVLSSLPDSRENNSDYLVVLKNSPQAGDGRFLDNGWMMELPHPVSKITWDNYAAVSHTTAKELGIKSNDKIKIQIGNRSLEIPAFIQPGSSDKTITIELGFGRKVVGIIGEGVGFDAIALMSKNGGYSPWMYKASNVTKGSGSYKLVASVEHNVFEGMVSKNILNKRGIIYEGTVEDYKKNPHFIKEESKLEKVDQIYPPIKQLYNGVKWGMAIDLNKCTGCEECVVACNAENNVPIVGKDEVANTRIMHWIRVDKYYSESVDEPTISPQVMLCQQCDDAPCENVCPVAATTHSPDGLNQQVYNRCIGTRYCENNCPYKVRRFNFLNYRDHFKQAYQQSNLFGLVNNPEVTVRSRGVMEKCTFCIQRIMEAKADAIRENRPLKGSDVQTACQVACNTNAIKFGDMNHKDSEFYKYRHHELGYYALKDLNTKPNVTYIAKLRNVLTEEKS